MSEIPKGDETSEEYELNENHERIFTYAERSLQVIIGATMTVVAGFLSQIWGSANISLRIALAEDLNSLGEIFLVVLTLSLMRYGIFFLKHRISKSKIGITLILWNIGMPFSFYCYIDTLRKIGGVVSQFAAVPN